MTEQEGVDFVWDDDPRLSGYSVQLADGHYCVVARVHGTFEECPRDKVGLLVRSGDSVRFLPVKKRRKPLELKHGQTWRNPAGTTYLLAYTWEGWFAVSLATKHITGPKSSPECALCLTGGVDVRDYGWELVE